MAIQNIPINPLNQTVNDLVDQLGLVADNMNRNVDEVRDLKIRVRAIEERGAHPLAPNPPAPQAVNPVVQAVAVDAEALFLRQLPNLKIYTDYHSESDGILTRIMERIEDGNTVKKIIGYYNGSSWISREWAFAPLASGNVPTIRGRSLDSGVSTWQRNHRAPFGPILAFSMGLPSSIAVALSSQLGYVNSGGGFGYLGYARSSDENGREYILITANGQDDFTGYVPARDVMTSLKNGYLADPNGFKLVYDKTGVLNLACNKVKYQKHGFELHGRVWWPVKSGNYADHADRIEEQVAAIDLKVREFLDA